MSNDAQIEIESIIFEDISNGINQKTLCLEEFANIITQIKDNRALLKNDQFFENLSILIKNLNVTDDSIINNDLKNPVSQLLNLQTAMSCYTTLNDTRDIGKKNQTVLTEIQNCVTIIDTKIQSIQLGNITKKEEINAMYTELQKLFQSEQSMLSKSIKSINKHTNETDIRFLENTGVKNFYLNVKIVTEEWNKLENAKLSPKKYEKEIADSTIDYEAFQLYTLTITANCFEKFKKIGIDEDSELIKTIKADFGDAIQTVTADIASNFLRKIISNGIANAWDYEYGKDLSNDDKKIAENIKEYGYNDPSVANLIRNELKDDSLAQLQNISDENKLLLCQNLQEQLKDIYKEKDKFKLINAASAIGFMWKIILKQQYDKNVINDKFHQESVSILTNLTREIIDRYLSVLGVKNAKKLKKENKNDLEKLFKQLDLGVMFHPDNVEDLSPFVYKNDVDSITNVINNTKKSYSIDK